MRGPRWRTLAPVLGVATLVVLGVALRGRERGAARPASVLPAETAAPVGAGAGGAASAGRSAAASPDERAREQLGALDPRAVWRARVATAVQRAARERLGRPLAPDAETRLVDAIATVGPAARGLDREALDRDDAAGLADARGRTATLVAADQVCREELGIGIAELLRVLEPDAIEDGAVTPAPQR